MTIATTSVPLCYSSARTEISTLGAVSNDPRAEQSNHPVVAEQRATAAPAPALDADSRSFSGLVIYTRYSTDMQNPQSCEDQERKVRQALEQMGIDHSSALVLHDDGIPGTRADRPAFVQLIEKINRGDVRILAVDDQSRFSRGDNAF